MLRSAWSLQEISPSGESGKAVTMATYIRDVFLEQVRLPIVVAALSDLQLD